MTDIPFGLKDLYDQNIPLLESSFESSLSRRT